MAARPALDKIKHSQQILDTLTTPKLFSQVYCETSVDQRTVQDSLAQLVKHGYCSRDDYGRYVRNDHHRDS